MAEDEKAQETKLKNTRSKQNEKLYDAEGVLNPKQKKAEKKKQKKAIKSAPMEENDSMEGDYDFKVDYTKKESDGEEEAEEGEDNDDGNEPETMAED